MRSVLLLAVASALGANAHYHIQTFNGGTTGLRQHYRQSGEIDSPITGNDINSDAIVCGFNKPLSTPATAVNVNAGSTATVTYSPNVFHPGPFQVYASRSTTPPFSWAKVYENWTFKSGTTQFQDQLGSSFSFPIPAGMASGRWLLRVEHNAMHQASQVGGAQFYVRCIDINVVNGGSVSSPSPAISLPGGYTSSTTGVVWPIYSGDNSRYPSYGPAVANWGSGGGNNNGGGSQTTVRTTTTTRPQQQTTTTTRAQQTTTTRTTTVNNGGGSGAALYGQCGGQGWAGPTTCAQGTCRASNQYYSQCLP